MLKKKLAYCENKIIYPCCVQGAVLVCACESACRACMQSPGCCMAIALLVVHVHPMKHHMRKNQFLMVIISFNDKQHMPALSGLRA